MSNNGGGLSLPLQGPPPEDLYLDKSKILKGKLKVRGLTTKLRTRRELHLQNLSLELMVRT